VAGGKPCVAQDGRILAVSTFHPAPGAQTIPAIKAISVVRRWRQLPAAGKAIDSLTDV
jgi:hypothetical protein